MPFRRDYLYENRTKHFLIRSNDYQKQYSHLYAHRLAEMTELLKPLVVKKWGANVPIKKLCELREDQDEEACVVIGTIYKHQAYKPSILREISEENQLAPQPQKENFCDAEDKVVLEDELQRIRLQGKVNPDLLGTGVVCAVYGTIEEDGRFDVEEMIFYEGGPQIPFPKGGPGRYLVFVSGIDLKAADEHVEALTLFQHWICGNIAGARNKCANIVRLILAGNTVSGTSETKTPLGQTRPQENTREAADAVCALDEWLCELTKSVHVDIMPGDCDPANYMLPQQPFHRCLFPSASRRISFQSVSNPYRFRSDNVDVLGCSGQNIKDIIRSTNLNESIDALQCSLTWSHIAPTAPDTLPCYPHIERDPFIISKCPHIYFVGNCEKYETRMHEGSGGQRTRLVCIPKFTKTESVVAVDLQTLDCQEIYFGLKNFK